MRPVLLIAALAVVASGCGHRPWDEAGDAWATVTTRHFSMITDADPSAYTPVLERLEDVHEALSRTFFSRQEVSQVQVLMPDRQRDFRGLTTSGDVAGFFLPGVGKDEEGVLVFPADGDFDLVASVAAHELAHRFLSAAGPGIPAWLHEGFANYVGAVNVMDDLVAFDVESIHGGYVYFSDPVALSAIFQAQNRDFHSADGLAHYMTAWIMIRYLFKSVGQDATKHFRSLVTRLAPGVSAGEQMAAVEAIFGISIAELQSQVQAFHAATYSGIGQERSRGGLGARVLRADRAAPASRPADAGAVKALCQTIRKRQGL